MQHCKQCAFLTVRGTSGSRDEVFSVSKGNYYLSTNIQVHAYARFHSIQEHGPTHTGQEGRKNKLPPAQAMHIPNPWLFRLLSTAEVLQSRAQYEHMHAKRAKAQPRPVDVTLIQSCRSKPKCDVYLCS
jgi:hypothetical protein